MLLHTFCPLMIQRSPSRTARVVSPARSEPAPGSLNSWHQPDPAVEDRRDEPVDLVGGAVGEDGRRGHEQAETARAGAARRRRRRSTARRRPSGATGHVRPPPASKCGAVQPASATRLHHSADVEVGVPVLVEPVRAPRRTSSASGSRRGFAGSAVPPRPPRPSSSRQLSRMILRTSASSKAVELLRRSRAGWPGPRRGASRSRTGCAPRRSGRPARGGPPRSTASTHTCWRIVSSGSSGKTHGVWLACLRRRLTSSAIQSEPFSMLATRSVGWRVNTPWMISAAMVSWMARSDDQDAAEDVDACRSPRRWRCAAPRGGEGVVAAVAEVEGDRDRRLGQARPHRVVELVAERPTGAVRAGHGRRAHVHDPGAALDQRVELGAAPRPDRRATASARAIRRSLVVEAPVLLEPAVEGGEARHGGRDVVAQRLLDAAAERGEQQHGVEPLLLGHLRPARRGRGTRPAAARPASALAGFDALGDLAPEQRVEAARAR